MAILRLTSLICLLLKSGGKTAALQISWLRLALGLELGLPLLAPELEPRKCGADDGLRARLACHRASFGALGLRRGARSDT